MTTERPFSTFQHGHQDLVLAADYNFYGNRLVTASSDHKLKVWDKKGDEWSLIDEWKAHDAEITEVRWNGPWMGQVLGSIGEDGVFRLWEEDLSQAPLSGRRFKSIMTPALESKNKLPFVSLDFKNYNSETYLALITRDGNLSIMEPKDQDNLAGDWSEWPQMQDFAVCAKPPRSAETSFRVCFHKDKFPCWSAITAGLDRRALSLVVAAMDTAKVYRTDERRQIYLAAELTGSRSLVRDVAWANGSARGYDVIATASKDGSVRIYELRSPTPSSANGSSSNLVALNRASTDAGRHISNRTPRNAPSGIGAGLAGASRPRELLQDDGDGPGRVKHRVELVADLTEHRGAVWRACFSANGDLLISTGDDGTVRTWKRGVDRKWYEYAEIDTKSMP